MPLSRELLGLAEDANTHTPLGPGEERIIEDGLVVFLADSDHPAGTVVQRLRLSLEEVDETVRRIRELLSARGRMPCTWEVGSSATPPDLPERLLALGMVPFEEPFAVGMVLTQPPAATDAGGPTARRVETAEEQLAWDRITKECFGMPIEPAADDLDRASRAIEGDRVSGAGANFLAFLDGDPVAAARATFAEAGVVLNAGCTLPRARGRGAYRALVAARWDKAVHRDTPALITQAGGMSRLILQRLGFREVAEIRIFLDDAAS